MVAGRTGTRPGGRIALASLSGAALLLFLFSLGIGPVALPPWTVASALAGSGSEAAGIIVRDIRLPRAILSR